MSIEQDWLAAAAALASKHGQLRGDGTREELKRLLAETYLLFAQAEFDIRDAFKTLTEEQLRSRGDQGALALLRGDFRWLGDFKDLHEGLAVAGGQLRALDVALNDTAVTFGRRSSCRAEWAVEGSPVLVVPRRRPRRITNSAAGMSFTRNALVHHRVLPAKFGDCVVDGKWLRVEGDARRDTRSRRLGAAMFRPFKLDADVDHDGNFVVTRTVGRDFEKVIDDQLRLATEERVFALVWPELSLMPDMQRRIERRLALETSGDGPAIDLVVMGSWHEHATDGVRNVARIVDGYGGEVTAHAKVLPYDVGGTAEFRAEKIKRGKQMTLILGADQIVAVLICRDLCDRTKGSPFEGLDVDLLLVPSHGNTSTMSGHQSRADDLGLWFGTQTFVVQHPTKPMKQNGHGLVLVPARQPRSSAAVKTQTVPFASYRQLTDDLEGA